MSKRTPLLMALVAVLGAAGGWWWWSQRVVTPALAMTTVPAATWTAYVAAVEASPPVPESQSAAVIAAVEAANRAEAAAGGEPSPALLQAAQGLAQTAWEFAQLRTPEAYLRLGRRQGLELQKRLAAFLGWCQQQGKTPEAALALNPAPPEVAVFLAVGGPLLRFAERAGLVAEGRIVPGREPFLQAVFLQSWIAPLRARMPLDPWVSGEERVWYLQWKVELQADGALDRRLAAADELAALPDYPADLNAGVLLLQAGRRAEAVERFQRSKHPLAAAYLRAAERAP